MSRSVVQYHAADGDRISQLPVEILDHIMGLLPVEQAAKTAVLSRVWRDVWFSLSRLCFDDNFFRIFPKKCPRGIKCVTIYSCLYVINNILLHHKGSIRKFVCLRSWPVTLDVRCESPATDKLLMSVTGQGVEEINLCFVNGKYKLPDCIFSCSTLRILHLERFYIEPQSSACILPNATSLSFKCCDFGTRGLSSYAVDVLKLENLSFMYCTNLFHFNIGARNLYSLTINHCFSSKTGNFLPVNLNLSSISVLDIDSFSLQGFLGQYTSKGHSLQPFALNVERLKLSEFCFRDDARISAFVCLLCKCPKLSHLEIGFEDVVFMLAGDINKRVDSGLLKKLLSVVRTHKLLSSLKLSSFTGLRPQMHFIEEMLASLPSLEEVVIICLPHRFDWNKKRDIFEEISHFPCASHKPKIAYR
ncbi:hypothetical protein DM860_000253 [Cuscuta australis]|uniref:F-box domain-containing protein n=2 Tax=Cuscuta sect. Cleistogrammica TaxID=1824901 RepID=A0A328CZP0_9ASTE|nr:hypothetical protein DM860_000253 [Cuscuta australis]